MKALLKFAQFTENINAWVAKIFAWLVLPIIAVSLFEIISRYFFDSPTLWAGQVMSFLFITVVLIGGGYVLQEDGHIRMDVMYHNFSPRLKAIIDVATFVIFFIFIIFLGYQLGVMAWTSLITQERSWSAFHGPIYPKKIAMFLAALLLFIAGFAYLFRKIGVLRRKPNQ